MVSVEYNKLTHSVYSERILPFINPFLYINPGFFKLFSSIIVNLGYSMSVVLVNWILSAGFCRRVISRRVIFGINEKR